MQKLVLKAHTSSPVLQPEPARDLTDLSEDSGLKPDVSRPLGLCILGFQQQSQVRHERPCSLSIKSISAKGQDCQNHHAQHTVIYSGHVQCSNSTR